MAEEAVLKSWLEFKTKLESTESIEERIQVIDEEAVSFAKTCEKHPTLLGAFGMMYLVNLNNQKMILEATVVLTEILVDHDNRLKLIEKEMAARE